MEQFLRYAADINACSAEAPGAAFITGRDVVEQCDGQPKLPRLRGKIDTGRATTDDHNVIDLVWVEWQLLHVKTQPE